MSESYKKWRTEYVRENYPLKYGTALKGLVLDWCATLPPGTPMPEIFKWAKSGPDTIFKGVSISYEMTQYEY